MQLFEVLLTSDASNNLFYIKCMLGHQIRWLVNPQFLNQLIIFLDLMLQEGYRIRLWQGWLGCLRKKLLERPRPADSFFCLQWRSDLLLEDGRRHIIPTDNVLHARTAHVILLQPSKTGAVPRLLLEESGHLRVQVKVYFLNQKLLLLV